MRKFHSKGILVGLRINNQVCYSIHTWEVEGRIMAKKHHGRSKCYSESERDLLAQIQLDNNEWTYNQVREEWKRRTGRNEAKLSLATMFEIFKEQNITSKQLRKVPR
jgi:hypothetical protein